MTRILAVRTDWGLGMHLAETLLCASCRSLYYYGRLGSDTLLEEVDGSVLRVWGWRIVTTVLRKSSLLYGCCGRRPDEEKMSANVCSALMRVGLIGARVLHLSY